MFCIDFPSIYIGLSMLYIDCICCLIATRNFLMRLSYMLCSLTVFESKKGHIRLCKGYVRSNQ